MVCCWFLLWCHCWSRCYHPRVWFRWSSYVMTAINFAQVLTHIFTAAAMLHKQFTCIAGDTALSVSTLIIGGYNARQLGRFFKQPYNTLAPKLIGQTQSDEQMLVKESHSHFQQTPGDFPWHSPASDFPLLNYCSSVGARHLQGSAK